jgi:hypothetical protein
VAAEGPLSLRPRIRFDGANRGDAFLPSETFGDPHLRIVNLSLRTSGGESIAEWELILQQDSYTEDLAAEWSAPWTNPRIEARIDALASATRRKTGEDPPGPWIDVVEPGSPEPLRWLPLLFRRADSTVLRPRCVECLSPLATCRDDAPLAALGLSPFGSSAERFLVCPECAAAGKSAPIYSAAPPVGRKDVRGPSALLQDQARIVSLARELDGPNARAVLSEFAPDGGPGPSADELAILNLHETRVLVRRRFPFGLREAARLVARAPEVNASVTDETPRAPGRIFAHDGSGLDALEVLRLKLLLFVKALRDVHALHAALAGPHLALSPDAFRADLNVANRDAAALWATRVSLIGMPAAFPVEGSPAPRAFVPRPLAEPIYLPDLVRDARYWTTRTGQLVVDGVTDGPGADVARAMLRDATAAWPPISSKDLLRLRIPTGSGRPALDLWARVADGPRRADALTLSILGDDPTRDALRRLAGVALSGVPYAVFPALHAPVDLYAMGMVLFDLLLTHDDQPMPVVEAAIADGRRAHGDGGTAGDEQTRRIVAGASAWLASSRHADVFHRRHLFADPQDRREGRPNAVPAWIWQQTMILGLRMTWWIAGFGFCRDHGDFDPNYPAGVFEPPLAELEVLLARIDSVLLGGHLHNREARHVIRGFGRGPAGPSPGE